VDYGADRPDQHRKQEPPAEPFHPLEIFSVEIIHCDQLTVGTPDIINRIT
jgi:hypothetical protein